MDTSRRPHPSPPRADAAGGSVRYDADAAGELLAAERFREGWDALHDACPWATAFQASRFVLVWYRCYREVYDPVVLHRADADGRLDGLLPLARHRDSGCLVVAGAHQAEYQAWLSRPEQGDAFIEGAIRLLRARHPDAVLTFRYLAPSAPTGWARERGGPAAGVRFRAHRRPLIRFGDHGQIEASLRKKSNKSRLNRLRRLGEVSFRECATRGDVAPLLDDITDQYDLRQGGHNDALPFLEDARKKDFHLELMRTPGILHATVLTAGDHLAACQIGARHRDFVSVGVFAHSPFLARHSPGKLHLLMLAKMLRDAGFACLDLTPGGAWKDRFATDWDEVEEMTVFMARRDAVRDRLTERIGAWLRRIFGLLGIRPAAAREGLRRVGRRAGPGALLAWLRRRLWDAREMRLYALASEDVPAHEPEGAMSRDAIGDLLRYEPGDAGRTRKEFLGEALSRLEAGEHAYTLVEDGRLVHCGWLREGAGKSFLAEVAQEFDYPDGSAAIGGCYTHPAHRGRGYFQRSLGRMLADAARAPDVRRIYVAVPADDGAARRAIEKAGFRYQGSLHRAVRLGRSRCRRSFPDAADPRGTATPEPPAANPGAGAADPPGPKIPERCD